MSATSGKVALVTDTAARSCAPPGCDTTFDVLDFVGYGSANDWETAPAPGLSNTTAALRLGGGAVDTDNNANDFTVGTPNPRNSGRVPTLTTSATATATLGGAISDTATVTGAAAPAPAPTGSVTFRLYGPDDANCVGAPVFTSGPQLLGGGPPPRTSSGPFTPPAPGTYRWVATYSGDANYEPVTAPCDAPNETSVITAKASPTISTQASAGGLLGTPVRDVATLSGGSSPTGTVTFRLFSDGSCNAQVFTSTNNLSGLSATSGDFTPAAAGTYRWTAVSHGGDRHNGDANNNTATSGCNAPNESVTITPFVAPTFTRTITADTLGPVTVNAGESVLISGTRVVGPVTVNPGGALSVENARISRGVTANAPAFFRMCGTDVSGSSPSPALNVTNAPVPIVVGDPASSCAGNRFAGHVVLTGNLAVTFGANLVSQNATVDNNGPGSTIVKGNTVYGILGCAGNSSPPTNAGQATAREPRPGSAPACEHLNLIRVADR